MQNLKLTLYGDPVLKARSDRIDRADREVEQLAAGMIDVMHQHAGVGLAAPQVGIPLRLIIVHLNFEDEPLILINPEITMRTGIQDREEGCLSLPGISTHLKRAETVRVCATDQKGTELHLEASGLAARAFQHEVDHIDGILLIDRMGRKDLRNVADHLERIRLGEIPPAHE